VLWEVPSIVPGQAQSFFLPSVFSLDLRGVCSNGDVIRHQPFLSRREAPIGLLSFCQLEDADGIEQTVPLWGPSSSRPSSSVLPGFVFSCRPNLDPSSFAEGSMAPSHHHERLSFCTFSFQVVRACLCVLLALIRPESSPLRLPIAYPLLSSPF
jgi:hypothetical protein